MDIERKALAGYAKLYDQENSKLCKSIGIVAELQTTQRSITNEEYNSIKQVLEVMRDILFSLKV